MKAGRTNLQLSAVGFGTCQLRLVPEWQAIDTLKRGFRLGVNWVHTAPDYEGAENLVARAIEQSGYDIIVLSQGYGDMAHFEYLFENTCRIFNKNRLELFGIACIDDREHLGENVWDSGGMIEFLLKKKREGRLGGIFCATHGPPEYISRLITSGYFDAILLAYNTLGFHILSYFPERGKEFENLFRIREEIFPLALQHKVALLIMKPLAGGLLCNSKAFPPYKRFSNGYLQASDLLREILSHPGVCSVVPGTASPAEAEENARAGHYPAEIPANLRKKIANTVKEMKKSLCLRCGQCEPLCSKSLPISWLFRDAYICNYPSETFETIDDLQYFHLHPDDTATCETCTNVTCKCPHGLNIRDELIRIHGQMVYLKNKGLLPVSPEILKQNIIKGFFGVQIVMSHIPQSLEPGQKGIYRFYLHNAGENTWSPAVDVVLAVEVRNKLLQQIPLRHSVEAGARTHITFEFKAPRRAGNYLIRFFLMPRSLNSISDKAVMLMNTTLSVTAKSFLKQLTEICFKRKEK